MSSTDNSVYQNFFTLQDKHMKNKFVITIMLWGKFNTELVNRKRTSIQDKATRNRNTEIPHFINNMKR